MEMKSKTNEALEALAAESGIDLADKAEGGPGRKKGSVGDLPNIKKMPVQDLRRELGTSRKKLKDLEGRVPVPAEVEGAVSGIPPELWGLIPSVAYDYLAGRYGDHWRLSEPELTLIGGQVERCANRYLGDYSSSHPELFGLLMVVVATGLPRVILTVKIVRARQKKADDDQAAKIASALVAAKKDLDKRASDAKPE